MALRVLNTAQVIHLSMKDMSEDLQEALYIRMWGAPSGNVLDYGMGLSENWGEPHLIFMDFTIW